MRARKPVAQPTTEYFSSYRARCWHPNQPLAVLRQWYEEGADTGEWRHADFYALYVIRGGRGIHVINGHPYPIRRGDVYMTAPGAVHSYRDYRQLKAVVFCFQASLFGDEELDALGHMQGFRDLFLRGAPQAKTAPTSRDYQLHLAPPDDQRVERLVDDLLEETQRAEVVSPLIVRGLMLRLLVALARAHAGAPAEIRAGSPALAEMLHLCDTRYAEGLTVAQLAALVFLSPAHFAELFTREVGTPPATYLRQLRLAQAQSLLRGTSLPICEVAQQSGFGDAGQLSRAFSSSLGMTPREYRRRFKE
jgi:AraC-like DNA-binding protein